MEAGCGPSTSGCEFAGLFFQIHRASRGTTLPHVAPRMYIEPRICSFLTKTTNNDVPLPGPRLGLLVYHRALGGVVRARFVLNSVGVRRGWVALLERGGAVGCRFHLLLLRPALELGSALLRTLWVRVLRYWEGWGWELRGLRGRDFAGL